MITLLLVSALISALTVLMVIWIAPAVRLDNSACEQYPFTSGCR